MNTPLRITLPQEMGDSISQALTIPHRMQYLNGQDERTTAQLIENTDILVSGAYRAEWGRNGGPHSLRLVHAPGAGIDDIDTAALPAGCRVCNVYGHERGVAEQAFMLILALHKNLLRLDANLRAGNWTPDFPYMPELRGRRLLVIGLGHIGAEIVRWGHFMEMEVSAITRAPSHSRAEALNLEVLSGYDKLKEHLPTADFVVIAIPASAESVDLIGGEELAAMKSTACLINVGRARVVNEEALYEALRSRSIKGAGLDVWYQYPPSEHEIEMPASLPFHELANVVMTPHKPTIETMEYRWEKIAENIERFSRNEPLENLVFTAL